MPESRRAAAIWTARIQEHGHGTGGVPPGFLRDGRAERLPLFERLWPGGQVSNCLGIYVHAFVPF